MPTKPYGLSIVSAVSGEGSVRNELLEGVMKTKRAIDFLQRLIGESRTKVLLILDNLRVQHAVKLKEWMEQHKKRIQVFFLTPYMPQTIRRNI